MCDKPLDHCSLDALPSLFADDAPCCCLWFEILDDATLLLAAADADGIFASTTIILLEAQASAINNMHFIVALSHDGCLVGGRADVMVQVCQSNKKWNDGFGIWIHPPREVGSYGERQTLDRRRAHSQEMILGVGQGYR